MEIPVHVSAGNRLSITLVDNPSTGYTWVIGDVPDSLSISKGDFMVGVCPVGATGCQGTVTFTIDVDEMAGGTTVSVDFYHIRPFEAQQGMNPTHRYTIMID